MTNKELLNELNEVKKLLELQGNIIKKMQTDINKLKVDICNIEFNNNYYYEEY